jgi:hypothetical protein
MQTYDFITDMRFCYSARQRARFVNGELGPEWAARYPILFDADDVRIYKNQSAKGYHFYEWLGAVLFYEATGFLSLVEKYGCASHPSKDRVYNAVVPVAARELECAGWPDLLSYKPDLTDWHFCEVKGKNDKLGDKQLETFKRLHSITGKKICVLWLRELGSA